MLVKFSGFQFRSSIIKTNNINFYVRVKKLLCNKRIIDSCKNFRIKF
jgi:hypothetical protein